MLRSDGFRDFQTGGFLPRLYVIRTIRGPKPSRFRKLVYADSRAINYRERPLGDRFSRCIMRRSRAEGTLREQEEREREKERARADPRAKTRGSSF